MARVFLQVESSGTDIESWSGYHLDLREHGGE